MAIEVTGLSSSLTPINRPEPRAPEVEDGPSPVVATEAINNRAPRQDVEIEMALRQRASGESALVEESSALANTQQERGELLDRLNTERERVAGGLDQNLSADEQQALDAERGQLTEDTLTALERIRANALASPFGNGMEDAGPLPENGFFVRDRSQTLDNLDTAISALERLAEQESGRINDLQASFNTSRSEQLSPGSQPVVDADEATYLAAEVSRQIRDEAPVDVNGLSTADRSTVLSVLQA